MILPFFKSPMKDFGDDISGLLRYGNRPEAIEICREHLKITDRYQESMMVGEVFTDNAGFASEYCSNGTNALHMDQLLTLTNTKLNIISSIPPI